MWSAREKCRVPDLRMEISSIVKGLWISDEGTITQDNFIRKILKFMELKDLFEDV